MVEVFKTTVPTRRIAAVLLQGLRRQFPAHRIGFDLEDCDRILRVETGGEAIDNPSIIRFLQQNGFHCAPLED